MGASRETRIGGNEEGFPTTLWSAAVQGSVSKTAESQRNLNRLCTLYWRPVYRFIRMAWSRSVEDAKDLTQGFFSMTLESDFLSKYDQEKGRFRHFLKAALRNYLNEVHRGNRALKRGGDVTIVSMEELSLGEETPVPSADSSTPEEEFDRTWVSEILKRALDQLKSDLIGEGREAHWKVYEQYELDPDPGAKVSYESVGSGLGLTAAQVKTYLHTVRGRLHEAVVRSVSDCVTSQSQLLLEMKELFSEP